MTDTLEETRLVEFPAYKESRDKLNAKRDAVKSIMDEAGPDLDMSKVKSLAGDSRAKVGELKKLNAEIDALFLDHEDNKVLARSYAEAKRAEGAQEKGGDEGDTRGGHQVRSLAEAFIKSEAFTGFRKNGGGQGPTSTINIPIKAMFDTGDWEPEVIRIPRIEYYPTRPAPDVANFFPSISTGQSAVWYMEETTYANTTAETAQNTQYPEANLKFTKRSRPIEKVAVYLPVTDELFEDVGESEDYVRARLPFMIRQRIDSQLLVGTGTSPLLLGTEAVSGINTQAKGADPTPDAIYKGMRKVRELGFAEPDVVFVKPSVWETVRLLRTANGEYIWGSPASPGPMTIWGVPVKETTAAPAGKALLGDYATYSALYVRRGIDVQVSNSHSDDFINGRLAVRADVRVAAVHYRPSAFAQVTGL